MLPAGTSFQGSSSANAATRSSGAINFGNVGEIPSRFGGFEIPKEVILIGGMVVLALILTRK